LNGELQITRENNCAFLQIILGNCSRSKFGFDFTDDFIYTWHSLVLTNQNLRGVAKKLVTSPTKANPATQTQVRLSSLKTPAGSPDKCSFPAPKTWVLSVGKTG